MNYGPTWLLGKGSTTAMSEQLGCLKVCAHWVPWILREPQNREGNESPLDLLDQYNTSGDIFLVQSFMDGGTWIHHSEPEFIWQSMEWCHRPPRKKEINSAPSAGKHTTTAIWNKKGVILVNFLKRTTVNSNRYTKTVSVNACSHWVNHLSPPKKKQLLHINTRLHTCAHHWRQHKVWMESVATPTLQSWDHTTTWMMINWRMLRANGCRAWTATVTMPVFKGRKGVDKDGDYTEYLQQCCNKVWWDLCIPSL
jgi:hypothetical protein